MNKDYFSKAGLLLLMVSLVANILMGHWIYTHECVRDTDTVTVVRRETVRVENPVATSESVTGYLYVPQDSVRKWKSYSRNGQKVGITDNLVQENAPEPLMADTTGIVIPITKKEYRDSSYYAVISGYQPSLDYIETYNRTVERTITNTVTKKKYRKLSIGLQAGYGYGFKAKELEPYVGVGVTWSLF